MRKFLAIALILGMGSLVAHLFHLPIVLVTGLFGASAFALHYFKLVPEGSLFMAFADLLWPSGRDNMAGIVGEIFFCPKDDIDTIPALSAVGSLNMAVGDITCKVGKKFYRIYHTQETGKVDYNTVGEIDGKSKQNLLSFFYPGDDEVLASQERLMQNTPGVYICKDTKGNLRLLGVTNFDQDTPELTLDSPAYLQDSNGTTGDAGSSRRGTTFNVIHKAPHRPVFYKGDVPLTAAT
jgi:hypothetical protein